MDDGRQALATKPEHESVPKTPGTAHPTRLALRLWSPGRVPLRWGAESSIIYLLSDLISAGTGSLVDNGDPRLIAHFEQSGQAYRSAKRIQWALFEFCQRRPDLCLGASVVLYQAMNPADERELKVLLDRSKPAQILATAAASTHLESMPGIQFRSLTSTPGARSEWQGGTQEIVWTSTSNLQQIQERLKITAQNQILASEPVAVAEQPTVDFSHARGPRPAPTLVPEEQTVRFDQPPEPQSLTELVENDSYSESSGSRYLWVSAAVAVILVALAFILVPRLRTPRTVIENPSPAPASVSTEDPANNSETPTATTKPETAPVSAGSSPSVSAPAPSTNTVEETRPSARHSPADQSSHPQPKKVTEYEGMSEKNIPMLLGMAEREAGSGNYEDARSKFNIVLRLDPGNAQAKLGLKKLDLSERESR
jgi:hypothetical protein